MFKLYGYWRSSASWRVRWALELKKIAFEYVPVNLLKGEQKSPEHMERSPSGVLPVLEIEANKYLNQSIPILLYLEKKFSRSYALFGQSFREEIQILELCEIINSDTAPLQTPRVQKKHRPEKAEQFEWSRHFIRQGFQSYEKAIAECKGQYSVGDKISAADLFLVPQIYNALRYELDLESEFPELLSIYNRALKTEEGLRSSPEAQCDAVMT